MMGHDLLRPDAARHGALRMTEAARPILRGEETIKLRRYTASSGKARAPVRALVSEEDEPLLAALKSRRRALAEAQRVPAYVVFTDRTLVEMAEMRPRTLDAFAQLSGVGTKKLEKYGPAFLEVITGDLPADVHPARLKLAGGGRGELFDRLMAAQQELARGDDGAGKVMSCSASMIARLTKNPPGDMAGISRILGVQRAERFGGRFLEVLNEA